MKLSIDKIVRVLKPIEFQVQLQDKLFNFDYDEMKELIKLIRLYSLMNIEEMFNEDKEFSIMLEC